MNSVTPMVELWLLELRHDDAVGSEVVGDTESDKV